MAEEQHGVIWRASLGVGALVMIVGALMGDNIPGRLVQHRQVS